MSTALVVFSLDFFAFLFPLLSGLRPVSPKSHEVPCLSLVDSDLSWIGRRATEDFYPLPVIFFLLRFPSLPCPQTYSFVPFFDIVHRNAKRQPSVLSTCRKSLLSPSCSHCSGRISFFGGASFALFFGHLISMTSRPSRACRAGTSRCWFFDYPRLAPAQEPGYKRSSASWLLTLQVGFPLSGQVSTVLSFDLAFCHLIPSPSPPPLKSFLPPFSPPRNFFDLLNPCRSPDSTLSFSSPLYFASPALEDEAFFYSFSGSPVFRLQKVSGKYIQTVRFPRSFRFPPLRSGRHLTSPLTLERYPFSITLTARVSVLAFPQISRPLFPSLLLDRIPVTPGIPTSEATKIFRVSAEYR